MQLRYEHVDVFSPAVFGGNSLPVFIDCPDLPAGLMLEVTRELRHFESVFLQATSEPRTMRARIFDLVRELAFAGHPLIGAAVALQHRDEPGGGGTWRFALAERVVSVEVGFSGQGYYAVLDQGQPSFLGQTASVERIAGAFSLGVADIFPGLPVEVVSTGLRYVVLPLIGGAIGRARILTDITQLMAGIGAEFAVLLDPVAFEIRHWNNDGITEDVATGSAAGVVAAYCVKHGLVSRGRALRLSQGRYVGRPSILEAHVDENGGVPGSVHVGGAVAVVGHGYLRLGEARRP